jgi:2'-5' RNA ligase
MPDISLERFFFALRPPRQEACRIAALAETLEPGCQVQRPDRHHLTLAITDDFEDYPDDLAERLVRAGDMIAVAPFEVVLETLSVGARSAALRPAHRNRGLTALSSAIRKAMTVLHAPLRAEWTFSPQSPSLIAMDDPIHVEWNLSTGLPASSC